MAAKLVEKIIKQSFNAAFSLFYSIFVVTDMLKKIYQKGFSTIFKRVQRDNRPKLLDSTLYGGHGFARLKNIKLHYVANGSESKPLMLFLHGFPEFWYSWRHQLKEFGGDYRAVAVDMRGYSESDKPAGVRSYTIDHLIQDIRELIPALGAEKCTLVAHDWGGAVAFSFAHMYPEMVEKLVVCNCPTSKAFTKYMQSNKKQFKRSWYMFFFQMPWLPELYMRLEDYAIFREMFCKKPMGAKEGAFTDEDIEMYKYTFSQPGALSPPINFYRAAFRYGPKLEYPTKKIQVPTLMIWGTSDGALGKDLAELSANDVEDYRYHYIDGASHWVQQEEPEQVNKLIRNFCSNKSDE